jgi:hypothetical protein
VNDKAKAVSGPANGWAIAAIACIQGSILL